MTFINKDQLKLIQEKLTKRGFTQLSQGKEGVWVREKVPNMRLVDLNKPSEVKEFVGLPVVCISTGIDRIEEDSGIPEIDDLRNEIAVIMKPKVKEQHAPKVELPTKEEPKSHVMPADVVKPKGDEKMETKKEEKGLITQEKSKTEVTIVKPLTQQNIIEAATSTSKLLVDIVEKAKLFSMISGKKYVRVEGWETLGALLLCSSEIVKIEEYKNGYKAEAIIKNQDGKIISNGIGICLRTEKNWATRDDFAICSMSQTRAIGKAYRLGFAWIMSLAGYEVCPVEEME